jgi:uncharacterized protein with gpF-like domain
MFWLKRKDKLGEEKSDHHDIAENLSKSSLPSLNTRKLAKLLFIRDTSIREADKKLLQSCILFIALKYFMKTMNLILLFITKYFAMYICERLNSGEF